MAQRLSRIVCAAVLFVLAGQLGAAQSPIPVPPRDADATPKSAEPAAQGKKLPAAEGSGVKLPTMYYTHSRTFNLPVVMDKTDRLLLNEIRLYMKTPSTDWTLQEKGDRALKQFSCKVDADGEYWYMLVLVTRQGKMQPEDLNAEPPSQRVMVDTVPPEIRVEQLDSTLRCTVKDANPDPSSLKAVSKTSAGDVELESTGPGTFRVKAELRMFPVVVSVADLAGNSATKEVNLGELLGVKANSAPTDAPKESAAKQVSPQEIDGLVEQAFGKGSRELKRPVRLTIGGLNLIVVAEKVAIDARGESVRFASASIAILSASPKSPAIFQGDPITFHVSPAVKQTSQIGRDPHQVSQIEIEGKDVIITLMPLQIAPPATPSVTPLPGPPRLPTAPPKIEPAPSPPTVSRFQPIFRDDGFDPFEKGSGWTIRFKFKIDPKAAPKELLPTPAKPSKLPLWTNEDLAKVRELAFGEPISRKLPKHKAIEATAHVMAKINHLNAKKTDGFMLALLEQRGDLRGLPFLMGDACRTREEQASVFTAVASAVRFRMAGVGEPQPPARQLTSDTHGIELMVAEAKKPNSPFFQDQFDRAVVAALTQIMMPESAQNRIALARFMSRVSHIDATKALARLAIFAPEDEVRAAAIEGLKLRREKDYTDILMQGFRYPLPAVSKRAAEALVKLERKDLLVNLIEVLESPDPRLPARSASKDGYVVRELVKVNHHRNCLLCHAPGNTNNTPEGVLKVAVPLPGEPLPKPSEGGGYQSTPPPSPDIVVRIDMTYLRQDFSVMMPVSDAHPWPELQRFDFLVRTREVSAAEAKAYVEDTEPGRLSPYHRAALYALRELTGRDTAPTAAAWRKLLKLAK